MDPIPQPTPPTLSPLLEYSATLGVAPEGPRRNGLGTQLALASSVLTALATAVAATLDSPNTAELTGAAAAGFVALAILGKFAQAVAVILARSVPLAPIPVERPVTVVQHFDPLGAGVRTTTPADGTTFPVRKPGDHTTKTNLAPSIPADESHQEALAGEDGDVHGADSTDAPGPADIAGSSTLDRVPGGSEAVPVDTAETDR